MARIAAEKMIREAQFQNGLGRGNWEEGAADGSPRFKSSNSNNNKPQPTIHNMAQGNGNALRGSALHKARSGNCIAAGAATSQTGAGNHCNL